MNHQLRLLVGDGAPDAAAIQDFIEDHEFPLVEDGTATFLFHDSA